MNDVKYWLWLSMVFGGGTHRLWQLLNIYETAEEICCELLSENVSVSLTDKDRANIGAYTLKNAEDLIAECNKKGVGIIGYSDKEYPNQLRYIADPPPVLFYKGNIGCLTGTRTITAVGTRKAGDYSIAACSRICSELAKKGFVIVSGFAVGIDIISHMAAANIGMPTVCVLGCGVDVDYPRENFKYRDKILSSGGVFISEYPPGTRPYPANFPRRNRILSGVGRAAVVFEGAEKSGSLITANLAAEQGRELFVLPPADIFSGAFSGNIKLLREGAVPVMNVSDIIDFFKPGSLSDAVIKSDAFAYVTDKRASMTVTAPKRSHVSELIEKGKKLDVETKLPPSEEAPKIQPERELNDIPEGLQRDIAALLLKEGRLHADVICSKLGIEPAELMTVLTELEIIGAVKSCPGRIYEII